MLLVALAIALPDADPVPLLPPLLPVPVAPFEFEISVASWVRLSSRFACWALSIGGDVHASHRAHVAEFGAGVNSTRHWNGGDGG